MDTMLAWLRCYRYELIAVSDGAVVMMLELVGSRYVAPHLGTSIYVWTAIIGVILGALAIGNYYGGRFADQGASDLGLMHIFLISSVLLTCMLIIQLPLLGWLGQVTFDPRLQALMAAIALFAPPALFMGMVSPYLAKLRLTSLRNAGQSVGRLYAANTAGSILGTFATGYFLLGAIGSRILGWALVIGLLAVSFAIERRHYVWQRVLLMLAIFIVAWAGGLSAAVNPSNSNAIKLRGARMLYDGDSSYAHYQVVQYLTPRGDFRFLQTDNRSIQSGVNLLHPTVPIFPYAVRFVQAAAALPEAPMRILMIGGGSLTVPMSLAAAHPKAQIDVVEIDPQLTAIARKYFGYTSPPNVHIINQDGRYFLNHLTGGHSGAPGVYDLIYMDAFTSMTPPFQLTTSQVDARLAASLRPSGALVVNLLANPGHTGSKRSFAGSSFATYSTNFTSVRWYQSDTTRPIASQQNVTLLASRSSHVLAAMDTSLHWRRLAPPSLADRHILTDDFAPVEILVVRD